MHDTSLYPAIRQEPGQNPTHRFTLATPWAYTWETTDAAHPVTLSLPIPAGYSFEPSLKFRPVWTLISPFELLTASITHDWLFGHQGGTAVPLVTHVWDGVSWSETWSPWTEDESNRLFGRILRELGVSKYRRRLTQVAFAAASRPIWEGGRYHQGPIYQPKLPQRPPTPSVQQHKR